MYVRTSWVRATPHRWRHDMVNSAGQCSNQMEGLVCLNELLLRFFNLELLHSNVNVQPRQAPTSTAVDTPGLSLADDAFLDYP